MKTFIVVPVFNEQERIGDFVKDLKRIKTPAVFVDDGSTDSTSKILQKYCKNNKNLTLLTHKINLGKGAALKTGCEYAFKKGAEGVVFMDSDGQHSVDDLDKFTEKLKEGYDVVIGSRNLGFGVPLDRFIGNKIASVMVAFVFGIYVSDLICGYRALSKKAFKKLRWESVGYGVETEMVARLKDSKLKHCEVPVQTIYYDSFKGVSILDAFSVMGSVLLWKLKGFRKK